MQAAGFIVSANVRNKQVVHYVEDVYHSALDRLLVSSFEAQSPCTWSGPSDLT